MKIETPTSENYQEMLALWENSVRATHSFISEDDITFFKPIIIEQAFPNVALRIIKNAQGEIKGFIGVSDHNIEMLFVLNEARGKGIGKALLRYAVDNMSATKVDVNEQNPAATAFYQHLGFTVIARSPLDGMGKPFPLLHMQLSSK